MTDGPRDPLTSDAAGVAPGAVSGSEADRVETEMQHLDRNFMELLGELRVALPGVQVLFAFLLVVPFNQGYTRMSYFDKQVYFATLLCTALAAILLIAPSIHHRLEFHRGDKAYLVKSANRLAIAGLAALAVAMSGAILLVSNLVFGTAAAVVATAGILLTFASIWYGMPLRRRARLEPPRA
jgi:high-affinity Fe2+/Pb2+ permease